MDSITRFLSGLLDVSASGSMTVFQAIAAVCIAYVGGVLSSLTPCVYPMIPITVSVVGGAGHGFRHGQKRTRAEWARVLWRSSAYVSGMCLVYAILGVLAGLTGKVFGTLTNTPAWYLGMGAVMSLAALMMMDVLPFDPVSLWDRFKRAIGVRPKTHPHDGAAEMGLIGAFTLGASSGFLAAPCTTPVLTSILAFIANTQSVGLGLLLMLGFALGLGTLLMVIAIFAGALTILPRSGAWMKRVKVLSGMILLAFAEYLIYRAGKLGGL